MRKLLILAGLLLASASATANPFLELSGLRVEATDLNPDDGIAATYSFNLTSASLHSLWMGFPPGMQTIFLDPLQADTLEVSVPGVTTKASYDGNGKLRTSADNSATAAYASAGLAGEFTAGAFTRLTFSVDYTGLTDYAAYNVAHTGHWTLYSSDFSYFDNQYLSGLPYDGPPQSGVFSISIDNLTENAFNGGFNISTTTYAYGSRVADVPEPASLGLMLAGLAGLGALRRRRAQ